MHPKNKIQSDSEAKMVYFISGYVNPVSFSDVVRTQDEILHLGSEPFFPRKLVYLDSKQRPFVLTLSAKFFKGQSCNKSNIPQSDTANIKFMHEVFDIGKSSYKIKTEIQLRDSGAIIAEWVCSAAYVNLSTRKPTPLPKSIKEEAEKHISGRNNAKTIFNSSDFEPKENRNNPLLVMEKEVKQTDIDLNNHAHYLFCYEMVIETATKHIEYQHQKYNAQNRVTDVLVWYRSECVLNDVITAHLWEDDSTSQVFIHLINKTNDNQIISLCRVKFANVVKSNI